MSNYDNSKHSIKLAVIEQLTNVMDAQNLKGEVFDLEVPCDVTSTTKARIITSIEYVSSCNVIGVFDGDKLVSISRLSNWQINRITENLEKQFEIKLK